MDLDLRTLLVVSALVVAIATVVFATTAALRHNDQANRMWTAGFIAALSAATLNAIWGAGDDPVPTAVLAAIGAATVFALGAVWSGNRVFDERRSSLLWVVLTAAVLTGAFVLAGGDTPDLRADAILRLSVAGVLAWLAAVQLVRGTMRHNLNSRLLQIVLGATGIGFVSLAALHAALSSEDQLSVPVDEIASLALSAAFVAMAIILSALRVERFGNWWSSSEDAPARTNLGLLGAEAFIRDGRDRVERATMVGGNVAVVVAQINDLDELNTAFGRGAGDSALVHFTRVLRSHVPASALLGHLGAGRFVVMSIANTSVDAETIVGAIRTGLIDAELAPAVQVRIDASFGTSDTLTSVADLDLLMEAASTQLHRAVA